MSALARRYARALFEVAEAAGAADAVAADLARVRDALADPAVRALLLDPQTPRQRRAAVLERLAGHAHPLTRNLVQVLIRRRREASLAELHEAFAALVRRARGEVEGVVESAKPLQADQLAALQQAMASALGRRVALAPAVNPDLIGGLRVRVGNTLYDGSIATALAELERRLMQAPVP